MKKKLNPSRKERLAVILLSLLFIFVAIAAVIKFVVRAPSPAVDTTDPADAVQEDQTDEPTGSEVSSPDARKEYCYTILVSGLDDDNGGSDTNILVRFDAVGKSIDLVSLPRDTLLNHEWASNKLNFAYAKGGTELLRTEIENLLGIPVDFYVTVNLKGFIALVDQIGGVDFDVPVDMDYDDPYQDLHIHYKKGLQHLNGQQAMEVVRWRKNNDGVGYATADIGRIETQHAFFAALARQVLQLGNISNLPQIISLVIDNTDTNLSSGNIAFYAQEFLKMGMDDISFYTLPYDTVYIRGGSYVSIQLEAWLDMINT